MKLLVIGSSEAGIFAEERRMLWRDFNVDVRVENRSGCPLEQCLGLLRKGMTPDTDAVMVWALTPWAWKRINLTSSKRGTVTVFGPQEKIELANVPTEMSLMVNYVRSINQHCRVHLITPAVKDLYKFNQTRLIKTWGERYADHLRDHPTLNPRSMNKHSRHVYNLFNSLLNPAFHWLGKNVISASGALNLYYSRPRGRTELKQMGLNRAPHKRYLRGETMHLDLPLLPDGLHGNREFVHAFMRNNKKILVESYVREEPRMELHNLGGENRSSSTGRSETNDSSYLEGSDHSRASSSMDHISHVTMDGNSNSALSYDLYDNPVASTSRAYDSSYQTIPDHVSQPPVGNTFNNSKEDSLAPINCPVTYSPNSLLHASLVESFPSSQDISRSRVMSQYNAVVREAIHKLASHSFPSALEQIHILDGILQMCQYEKETLWNIVNSNC